MVGLFPFRLFHQAVFSLQSLPEQFEAYLFQFTLQDLPNCFQTGVRERSAVFRDTRLFFRIPRQMETPGMVSWRRMPVTTGMHHTGGRIAPFF